MLNPPKGVQLGMHAPPETPAEVFALHLEREYGVQLDPSRHAGLVNEINEFLAMNPASFADPPQPPPPGAQQPDQDAYGKGVLETPHMVGGIGEESDAIGQ